MGSSGANGTFASSFLLPDGPQIRIGMPVRYQGKRAGAALDRVNLEGKILVIYSLRQHLQARGQHLRVVLAGLSRNRYLRLKPKAPSP